MEAKTNVMRILESKKIKYNHYSYIESGAVNGLEIAAILGQDKNKVFKTLVTVGKSKNNFVFVIPVGEELDLKKAALAAGEKSVEMIKQKELLPLTGYIHGGCSPVGMKKFFTTFFDSSAQKEGVIFFSAGKVGYQVEVDINDLKKVISFEFKELTVV